MLFSYEDEDIDRFLNLHQRTIKYFYYSFKNYVTVTMKLGQSIFPPNIFLYKLNKCLRRKRRRRRRRRRKKQLGILIIKTNDFVNNLIVQLIFSYDWVLVSYYKDTGENKRFTELTCKQQCNTLKFQKDSSNTIKSHSNDFSQKNSLKALSGLRKPSQNLLVQSSQWKHQHNVWNLFKVNNKDTRTTLLTHLTDLNKFHTLWGSFRC